VSRSKIKLEEQSVERNQRG